MSCGGVEKLNLSTFAKINAQSNQQCLLHITISEPAVLQ